MPLFPLLVVAGMGALAYFGKKAPLVIAADQYQRHRHHKQGEGVLTPREDGLGIVVALESTSDLGRMIAECANLDSELEQYIQKLLQMTVSEAGDLRAISKPFMELKDAQATAIAQYQSIESALAELGSAIEAAGQPDALQVMGLQKLIGMRSATLQQLEAQDKAIKNSITPITVWLRNFPKSRISKA